MIRGRSCVSIGKKMPGQKREAGAGRSVAVSDQFAGICSCMPTRSGWPELRSVVLAS